MTDPTEGFPISIPEPLLDRLATLIADRVAERISPPPEEYIGSEEAASYLGFRGQTAAKKMSELASSGKVNSYRDGGRLLFKRSDLDAYVSAPRDRFQR